jgi:prevent-host-death family protein
MTQTGPVTDAQPPKRHRHHAHPDLPAKPGATPRHSNTAEEAPRRCGVLSPCGRQIAELRGCGAGTRRSSGAQAICDHMCPRSVMLWPMEQVGIRELRDRVSAVLRRVAAGRTVEVTDHGHPVARIVPLRYRNRVDQMVAEGRATPAEGDLLDEEPLPVPPGAPSGSRALADLRADER